MIQRLVSKLNELSPRRLAVVFFLGFSSGLPLALTGGTLQAWLAVEGVDLRTIGFFTLAGLPYTLKFLWAPVMDRFVPPFMGRRRGWLISCQVCLAGLIALLGALSPQGAAGMFAALALGVAFVSASQDIVVDAYRADILRARERGLGAAVSVTGYRIAMLVSGALAMILAGRMGWHFTYTLMAALMAVGMAAALLGPEPEDQAAPPRSLSEAVTGPLREFFSRPGAGAILALIVLYKLGDVAAASLSTAFLIRGAGFSVGEVGAINKGVGLAALMAGALAGGALMTRLGLFRALMGFGILQAVSILSFTALALAGKNYPMMFLAVGLENLMGGMGTSAFVAWLMALCNHRFTATQFALLSALAALGRVLFGPFSGYIAQATGWAMYFVIAFVLALPGLTLLWTIRSLVQALDQNGNANVGTPKPRADG